MATPPNTAFGRALVQAQASLPDGPIHDADEPIEISGQQFEVVMALNLMHPWRSRQDYGWLEVIAADERLAVQAAIDWLASAPAGFECTGLLRAAGRHDLTVPVLGPVGELPVRWDLPIDDAWAERREVREPTTGYRVGYLATDKAAAQLVPAQYRDELRLIVKKPSEDSVPVVLAPRVHRPA